jgi:hypothetical protein
LTSQESASQKANVDIQTGARPKEKVTGTEDQSSANPVTNNQLVVVPKKKFTITSFMKGKSKPKVNYEEICNQSIQRSLGLMNLTPDADYQHPKEFKSIPPKFHHPKFDLNLAMKKN